MLHLCSACHEKDDRVSGRHHSQNESVAAKLVTGIIEPLSFAPGYGLVHNVPHGTGKPRPAGVVRYMMASALRWPDSSMNGPPCGLKDHCPVGGEIVAEPPQFVEEIMPSNTSNETWTKVAVPIEVYQCDLTKVATTRQFGDLVSWAGVGALSSAELAKSLIDETSPPRRGIGFLVRHGEQAYYLITNSQVLFGVRQDGTEWPSSTNRCWLLDYEEENELRAASSPALAHVRFLSLAIEPTKLRSFPAISYPYLNIAVVNIDWESKLFRTLMAAGHVFALAGDLAEEPSAEGAEIIAIGLASSRSNPNHDIREIAISKGLVISSRNEAFLTNIDVTPGGPIVERDKIVGISTSQVSPRVKEDFPDLAPPPFAIAAKASYLKVLLHAHQQDNIC
jgi:hypothetical protein